MGCRRVSEAARGRSVGSGETRSARDATAWVGAKRIVRRAGGRSPIWKSLIGERRRGDWNFLRPASDVECAVPLSYGR